MNHFSRRTFGLIAVPVLGMALTACGATAINADYTPAPTQSSSPNTVIAAAQPSRAATKKAPKAKGHATTQATRNIASKTPIAPTTSEPPSGSGGGTHQVTSTAATITVTPSAGLTDGQTVTIHGTHFNPKIQVIAVECVNNGNSTQASNCNISLLALPSGFYPSANGTFTTTLKVNKSFGGNTCSAKTPCLVSVTEPNNNPTEEADTPFSFR